MHLYPRLLAKSTACSVERGSAVLESVVKV